MKTNLQTLNQQLTETLRAAQARPQVLYIIYLIESIQIPPHYSNTLCAVGEQHTFCNYYLDIAGLPLIPITRETAANILWKFRETWTMHQNQHYDNQIYYRF